MRIYLIIYLIFSDFRLLGTIRKDVLPDYRKLLKTGVLYTTGNIPGVSGGIVNILGCVIMDYSE